MLILFSSVLSMYTKHHNAFVVNIDPVVFPNQTCDKVRWPPPTLQLRGLTKVDTI
jgi:hypothetical protein